jgi:hypothetical protein
MAVGLNSGWSFTRWHSYVRGFALDVGRQWLVGLQRGRRCTIPDEPHSNASGEVFVLCRRVRPCGGTIKSPPGNGPTIIDPRESRSLRAA